VSEGPIEKHGIDWIPLRERRGSPRDVGLMWAGATTNVFPVIYGAILISLGLSWVQAAIIIVIGNLSYVLVGLASLTGPLAGTTTFTISRAAFGPNGNRGVGVLNWVMQLGFEVLGLASVVLAALVLLDKAGVAGSTAIKVVVIATATLAQAVIPLVGHAAVLRFLKWLVPPFVAMFVLFGILAAGKMHITSGSNASFATVAIGFALVLSSGGLSYVVNAADYTRYLPPTVSKPRLSLWVTLGGFVPWTLLELLGAAVATAVPAATDPISGLPHVFATWFLVPYLIMLIAQVYAGNAIVLYSSSVTLQAIGLKVARWQAVLIDTSFAVVLVGLITFSSAFDSVITDFLLFMLVWFGPWVAIFLIDFLLRRGRYESSALMDTGGGRYWRHGGVHWPGAAAQLAGMCAAAAWIDTPVWKGPLSSATHGADLSIVTGAGVAAVVYLVSARTSVRQEVAAAEIGPGRRGVLTPMP
jgi:NCS1 family nucleobase:cation symporter-1